MRLRYYVSKSPNEYVEPVPAILHLFYDVHPRAVCGDVTGNCRDLHMTDNGIEDDVFKLIYVYLQYSSFNIIMQ